MFARIDWPDLTGFSQPAWNDAQSVQSAFLSILAANDGASSRAAYHKLLYALGNNHAGTYYSVALAMPPLLEGVLRDGSAWSQCAALHVLIELCGSFEPEQGHEVYGGSPLDKSIRQASVHLVPLIKSLANKQSVATKSARELLEIIDRPSDVAIF